MRRGPRIIWLRMGGPPGGFEEAALRGAKDFAVLVNGLAAEDGAVDYAAEGAADVGGEFVGVEEMVALQRVGSAEVDEGEVGVVAGGDVAFGGEGETGGDVGGGEAGDLFEGEVGREGEENREGGLDAGDAAPDGEEIWGLFHGEGGGGMVGADGVEIAGEDVCPKRGGVGGGGERGGAVGDGAEAEEIGFGEGEIVGAGFGGEGDSGFVTLDQGAGFGGADVDDVEGAAGYFGESDGAGDGGE